ncbi:MAG: hypothetical protein U0802_12700 [Candidatus Binatia bacterium]
MALTMTPGRRRRLRRARRQRRAARRRLVPARAAGRRALAGAALPVLGCCCRSRPAPGVLLAPAQPLRQGRLPDVLGRGVLYLRTYVAVYDLWPFLPLAVLGLGLSPPGPARRFLLSAVLAGAATALSSPGSAAISWSGASWRAGVGVVYPAIVVGAAAAATAWRGREVGWAAGAATAAAHRGDAARDAGGAGA